MGGGCDRSQATSVKQLAYNLSEFLGLELLSLRWFPSPALQPAPNPCLVPQVFLAELGRQITLLAVNDRPPDDDDDDWQQNQRPQGIRQERQSGHDEEEAEIYSARPGLAQIVVGCSSD